MNRDNAQLAPIRDRLLTRRQALLTREQRVEGDLRRVDGPLSADFSEQAVQVQNDEALQVISAAAAHEIAQIDEALERIQKGTYGVCKHCGAPIAPARLAIQPQAVLCATCG